MAVIGGASSGEDISREIAQVAASVHRCSRGWGPQDCPSTPEGNVWRHPMLDSLLPSGEAVFGDGACVHIDVLLHCTGYRHSFPFLRGVGARCLSVEGQRVGPLYDHVFPPSLAPTLALVGLPWQVAPFPLCQLQAKWVAQVLAGKVKLPAEEEMGRVVGQQYGRMEQEDISPRYTHRMGGQAQVRGSPWSWSRAVGGTEAAVVRGGAVGVSRAAGSQVWSGGSRGVAGKDVRHHLGHQALASENLPG